MTKGRRASRPYYIPMSINAEAGADTRLKVFKIKAHSQRPSGGASAAEVLDWHGNCQADLKAKEAFQIDLSTRRDAAHNLMMVQRLQTLAKWVAWQGAELLQRPDTTAFPEQWQIREPVEGPSQQRLRT
eukprot:4877228-Amphidinium_carterae.1